LIVCYCIVKKGVKYSGKIIVFTAFVPYLFLSILFLRGIFLAGALEGLKYLFVPNFEALFNYKIWVDAFVQVFYQISVATGTIVNLSSMK
jgi:SNF family Na+-dependent transporter